MNNLIILNSMMRLSRIVRNLKNARRELNFVLNQTEYFIVESESSNLITVQIKASIENGLFVEKYLRSSVSRMCTRLDGFNPGTMDPIDYISSNDINSSIVELCRGKKMVANINLTTGNIVLMDKEPEQEIAVEDKDPAEKS